MDTVILVDENDNEVGVSEKLAAHKAGVLHRAFSVFIFNSSNELLLQQRSDLKYHSAGLWSNTCCSHPSMQDRMDEVVKRRLKEEMGIDHTPRFRFSFIYKAEFENGLTEHELDHVYFGHTDALPQPNPLEVKDWKYMSLDTLEYELEHDSENYTAWLKICFPMVKSLMKMNT